MVAHMSDLGIRIAVAVYFGSRRLLARTLTGVRACFDGLWLGLLSPDTLHAIDEAYYNRQEMYVEGDYNRRGL